VCQATSPVLGACSWSRCCHSHVTNEKQVTDSRFTASTVGSRHRGSTLVESSVVFARDLASLDRRIWDLRPLCSWHCADVSSVTWQVHAGKAGAYFWDLKCQAVGWNHLSLVSKGGGKAVSTPLSMSTGVYGGPAGLMLTRPSLRGGLNTTEKPQTFSWCFCVQHNPALPWPNDHFVLSFWNNA
jgi:hypothetical protein